VDNNRSSAAGGGIGLGTLLFVVFLVLKLCNVINWSWWWVTAPVWIPVAAFTAIMLVVVIVAVISVAIENFRENRRR
jgi:hypothetical protein